MTGFPAPSRHQFTSNSTSQRVVQTFLRPHEHAMSHETDLVQVVNRAALIENILNQVIEDFCEPRKEPFMFFWNVILDSSIMPMGSKVKVAAAIAQELGFDFDRNALHQVMALRNAFAHHKVASHPVISVAREGEDNKLHHQLQVLSNSGTLTRKRREDALAEFETAFRASYDSVVALKAAIKANRSQ